jgi:hypothetical protein
MIWGIPKSKGGIVNRKAFYFLLCILFLMAILSACAKPTEIVTMPPPSTDTQVPVTKTPLKPTATQVPATKTLPPPTDTPAIPTQTLEPSPTTSSINELPMTELVSVASDGTQGNADSYNPSISADGRYVTFSSDASNLVEGDTNEGTDIFVHDRVTGETQRVSVASDGTQGNGSDDWISSFISADGRYVAFSYLADNLVRGDTNGVQDVFEHDRVTGKTTRVSVASDGSQANGASGSPYCYCNRHGISISADGRYVSFMSEADNLVEGATHIQGKYNYYVHDRVTGETTVADVPFLEDPVTGETFAIFPNVFYEETHLSADGRCETFSSDASNLVEGDTNGVQDCFVRDLGTSKQPIGSITELYGVWKGLWSTDQNVFMEFIATMQPRVGFEEVVDYPGDDIGREWFDIGIGILTFGDWVKGAWVKPFSASTDCINNPQATYEVYITYLVDHPKKLRFVLVGEDHCIDRQTFLDGQTLTWVGTYPP